MIPRSGSVSLLNALSESLNFNKIGEPFNSYLWKTLPNIETDNTVIKTFIDQTPDGTNPIEFYTSFVKEFDKVILVSRKNIIEAVESYSYHIQNSTKEGWVKPYYYDDNTNIDKYYDWFLSMETQIIELSKNLDIEIDWYEDIFSGDVNTLTKFLKKHQLNVNLDIFMKFINPKNRYRQFKPIII